MRSTKHLEGTLATATLALLGSLALASRPAMAQPADPPAPPSWALEACRGRNAGDACTMNTPHGTLAGTCVAGPSQGLVCRPAGPPPGHAPPPEAFAACRGRNPGDACTVDTPHGTINGTCVAGPDQALHCRPAGPPPGHQPPPASFAACRGRNPGDACTVETPHGILDGTCVATPDVALHCRPARMPPPAP